ncbi:MAG: alpha/beta fold hydrolase [Lachnospiraceae bacterium]|nr:alpha/beta fold hydrolase [Lachnospiraceae bacterium]
MAHKKLKLTLSTLVILFGVNNYIDSSVESNNTKTSGKYFNWEHGKIFYKVSGEGMPVLLIHDLNVFSSESEWTKLSAELSKRHKTYTIDLLGCGRSDKPALTYTNYLYVQLITDFIKKVIKEAPLVVASGFSSTFVLKADAMDDQLMDSIYMINPPSLQSLKKNPNKYSKFIVQFFSLPVIGKTCYYLATSKTNAEYYLSEKCFFNPFQLKDSTVTAAYMAAHQDKGNGKHLYACLKANYLNVNITNIHKDSPSKKVLILGEEESDAKEIAMAYRNIYKNLSIRTIKATKKLPHLEAPEKIAGILNEDETAANNSSAPDR